jgi:hypothetical protein
MHCKLRTLCARLARFLAAGGRNLVAALNAVTNVGTHAGGRFTATASGTVTEHTLVKLSSAGVVAANDGVPCGLAESTETDGYEVGVQALGGASRTVLATASAAIAANAIVIADSAKVKTLPTGSGTYYIVGQALTAADADGDLIELAPCAPIKIVVA